MSHVRHVDAAALLILNSELAPVRCVSVSRRSFRCGVMILKMVKAPEEGTLVDPISLFQVLSRSRSPERQCLMISTAELQKD